MTVAGMRDALIKKAPFYSKAVIPGGTYKGNDSDVETVAVGALWVSRNNIPEDVQYGVVKGLFGNKKAAKVLANGHAKGKSMTLDTALMVCQSHFVRVQRDSQGSWRKIITK